VSQPDCGGGGYAATGDGLQGALDAADVNIDIGGTPDTVRVGAGTFLRSDGAGFQTEGGDIRIVGSGQATVITASASGSNKTVLGTKTAATAAAARNLRVDMPTSAAFGLARFSTVSDVVVAGSATASFGIDMPTGGWLSRSVVEPAKLNVAGVRAPSGVVEDTVIRVRKGNFSPYGIQMVGASGASELTMRHLTIVGDGSLGSTGIATQAQGTMTSPATTNVHLRDSLLRGLDRPLFRSGSPGTANLDFRYSSLDLTPGESVDSGPGTMTQGAGNLDDPDPLLSGDLRPLAGSPLIDMGDPAAPQAGDSLTDAGGGPRIIGGRRDIGAFEFDPSANPLGGSGSSVPGTRPATQATTALAVSDSTLTNKRFRAGFEQTALSSARRKRARPAPTGTTIRYTLSAAAAVAIPIERKLAGQRVLHRGRRGRSCVRRTRRNATRKNRRCVLYKRVASLSRKGSAGRQGVAFSGRIGRRRLRPGSYRLTVTAKDAGGSTQRGRNLAFAIVR
jgi:hypothetical protein